MSKINDTVTEDLECPKCDATGFSLETLDKKNNKSKVKCKECGHIFIAIEHIIEESYYTYKEVEEK